MARYEHPYRLDAAVMDALLAHLNRLINAANGETRCDHGEMRVPLLTAHHLSTLMNVSFWASFKKEEGRSVNIAVKYGNSCEVWQLPGNNVPIQPPCG